MLERYPSLEINDSIVAGKRDFHIQAERLQLSFAPLDCRGSNDAIEFLKRVFGAKEIRRSSNEAGGIAHSQVRTDDTVIMISDSVKGWPPIASHIRMYVLDVDATYKSALNAGAESVQEPMKKDVSDK